MQRCVSGLLRVTCFLSLVYGFTASVSQADPGTMVEPRQQQRGIIDPVVERVRVAIAREARDARYDVRIFNFSDYVLLQGEVDSQNARERIVAAAHAAATKPIRDEMRLRPGPSDQQVAAQVKSALEADYPQLASRITVEVRDGIAYLTGDLRNHREVDQLLSTTLMVNGVKDIHSDITLSGHPYAHRHLRIRKGHS